MEAHPEPRRHSARIAAARARAQMSASATQPAQSSVSSTDVVPSPGATQVGATPTDASTAEVSAAEATLAEGTPPHEAPVKIKRSSSVLSDSSQIDKKPRLVEQDPKKLEVKAAIARDAAGYGAIDTLKHIAATISHPEGPSYVFSMRCTEDNKYMVGNDAGAERQASKDDPTNPYEEEKFGEITDLVVDCLMPECFDSLIEFEESPAGWTALHQAALFGHEDAITYLVNSGVPVDILDNNGRTPAYYAAHGSHGVSTIRHLKQLGAELTAEMPKITLERSRETSYSAYGITRDAYLITLRLIQGGASVEYRSPTGQTLLHLACQEPHEAWGIVFCQLAEELVRRGVDPNAKDDDGNTALHTAMGYSGWQIKDDYPPFQAPRPKPRTGSYYDLYANPARHDSLFDAEQEKEFELRALLALGADVNAQNNRGETPLMRICNSAHEGLWDRISHLVEILETEGTSRVDFNLKDENGWTALVRALQIGEQSVFEKMGYDCWSMDVVEENYTIADNLFGRGPADLKTRVNGTKMRNWASQGRPRSTLLTVYYWYPEERRLKYIMQDAIVAGVDGPGEDFEGLVELLPEQLEWHARNIVDDIVDPPSDTPDNSDAFYFSESDENASD